MKLIKKEIKGTNGYKVTQKGNVYNPKGTKLNTFINPCGFKSVMIEGVYRTVAYLVAKAFLDNPDNEICLGFKDGDRTNCNLENLFWYYEGEFETMSDKRNYEKEQEEELEYNLDFELEARPKKKCEHLPKPIVQINQEGEIIKRYSSINKLSYGVKYSLKHKRVYKNDVYMFESDYSKENAIEYYKEATKKIKRKYNNSLKTIVEVDIEGNIIREFKTINECAKHFNCGEKKIRNTLAQSFAINDSFIIYKRDYSEQTTKLLLKRMVEKKKNK